MKQIYYIILMLLSGIMILFSVVLLTPQIGEKLKIFCWATLSFFSLIGWLSLFPKPALKKPKTTRRKK